MRLILPILLTLFYVSIALATEPGEKSGNYDRDVTNAISRATDKDLRMCLFELPTQDICEFLAYTSVSELDVTVASKATKVIDHCCRGW